MRNATSEDHLSFAAILTALNDLHSTARSILAARAVLACETWAIGPDGIFTRSWTVPFRCIALTSQSTQAITITSSAPDVAAPKSGPGIAVIGAGKSAVCNIAGRTLTIYGLAGDLFTIQVFAATQAPSWG